MAKKNYSNWAKSFGKSVKFGAKEILSDIAPNIAETTGSLQEDVRELRQDIRKLRANKRQVVNYLLGEEENFSQYAKIGLKNAKSSFNTGKLIDPKRADKMAAEAMGLGDFDLDGGGDFDFNFDDSNDSFESANIGPSKIVNVMNGPSSKSISALTESVAGTTEAINTGFDKLDRANKNAFTISEALEKRFHAEKMGQLESISSNLVNIVQFNNETFGTFVKASMEFYDKNLEVLSSINEAMLRISPVPKTKQEREQIQSPVDQFMSGGFSLRGYANLVKGNARKAFQNNMLTMMLPMLNNKMILADLAANPLGTALKWTMESLIPSRFSKSLGRMDKGFGNFIPALLAKIGHYDGTNPFLSTLSEIFGIKSNVSAKKFKQGDYDRGAIPFDGETKAAITRVIPGYLSRQTALLEIIAKHQTRDMPWTSDDFEDMIKRMSIVYNDSSGVGGGSFMRYTTAKDIQRREEREHVTREYTDSAFELRSKTAKNSGGIDRTQEVYDYLIGATHSGDELKLKDLDQIKKFMWIGAHDGKRPTNDSYKKDIDDQVAKALQKALGELPPEIALSLYGRERMAARAALSNYNTGYGSDDEHGLGRNTALSKINRGSAVSLYRDEDSRQVLDWTWGLERVSGTGENAVYYMPPNKLEEFKQKHKYVKINDAKDVYKYLTRKRKENGEEGLEANINEASPSETKSITSYIQNMIRAPFDKMADLFDAVNQKMYEIIFGKDGLGGSLEDLVLGKKDEKGRRQGGWFSSPINAVTDAYASTKTYLFGGTDEQGKKVDGLLTNSFKKFQNLMEDYFLGEEKEVVNPDGTKTKQKRKSVFETIQTTLVEGFGGIASTLFGNANTEEGHKKSLEEAKAAFNKAIPDIGKGAGIGAVVGTVSGFGGFGLLGSLFLPGGPIGGALVGGAVGLLSQSKAFREMLFGKEETDEQGNVKRVGGLISSKVVDWIKSKKTAIMGGAAMGTISTAMGHGIAFGLMPSIAVGAFGPVIAGAAWGVISHSERFRTMMFGKEVTDENGEIKRVGGLLNGNMISKFKTMLPRGIAGALTSMASFGVISQLGIIGNMVALGPIPAAIFGAGLGIASASEKFTKRMFGYQDEHGNYHSGALDKMKNFFTVEIFEPLKLRVQEELFGASVWIRKNVFRPFRRAVVPIKIMLSDIGNAIKDGLGKAFKPIKDGIENVFFVITDNLKAIFKPMVDAVKSISGWMFKRFKTAMKMSIYTALLPLRMVGGLARMYVTGKDYKSGVTDAVKGVGSAIKNGTGVMGALGTLGKAVFNPETRLTKENEEDERLRKEDEQYELEGNAVLQAQRQKLLAQQAKMRAGGYSLTEEQIREKFKKSEKVAQAEAKNVEDASKSKDLTTRLMGQQVNESVKSNISLTTIKDTVKSIAAKIIPGYGEPGGAGKDDNASTVDEANKEKEKEEAAAEREERIVTAVETTADNTDPTKIGKDKDKKGGFFSTLLGGIGSIASGVLGLFSNIGTLGAAALGIYGLLKMFFGDKGKGGKSEQLAHSTQAGQFAEIGLKKTANLGIRAVNAVRNSAAVNFAKEMGGAIKSDIGSVISRSTTLTNAKNVIEGKIGSFKEKLGKHLGDPNSVKKGFGSNIIEKINSALSNFTKTDIFKKLFGKDTGKITRFVDAITDLAKHLGDSEILSVIKKRFPKKAAEATAKTGVAATGVGLVLTVGFGIYDGITGALEADRLFDVNPADVTLTMRLISSFVNTFFGLPPMMWIDLLLTAASFGALALSDTIFGKVMKAAGYDLKDFDHRKLFARFVFDLISDEADSKKLDADQKKFDNEFKAYAKKHGKGDDYSKEQYREDTGNKTTWQKYGAPILDKVLGIGQDAKSGVKSFGERISTWMDQMVNWFSDTVKKITSFSPIDWFKETIGLGKDWTLSGAFNRIGERLNNWLPDIHPVDKVTTTTTSRWEKVKGAAKTAKNFFFGEANGYQYMNDAKWKDDFGENGCGPMTLANMLGISPELASKLGFPGDNTGFGTKSSYFKHAAGQLGIPYRENQSPSDLLNALKSGVPTAIGGSSSNPNSPFYGNGHYIMAKGMDSDGNVNIVNPTSSSKGTKVGIDQLMKESIGNGGFSGSFIGAGRMTLDQLARWQVNAKNVVSSSKEKGTMPSAAELKRYEEEQKKEAWKDEGNVLTRVDKSDEELAEQMTADAKKNGSTGEHGGGGTDGPATPSAVFVDEETAALQDAQKGIKAKTDGTKETITKSDATTTGKTGADSNKLSLTELLAGIGLGMKNLFSSVWGGTKYQFVSISDIKNGLKSLFSGGVASGAVQKKLLESARSFLNRGIKYSQSNPGRLDPDSSGYTDCSGYTAAIYKKAFGKDMLTPYGGEFDDPDMKGQWNESEPIDESQAQIGDLVFWETAKGVPDNHVGMVTDPAKHMAVASNTSTGPAEFQWDNSYWKPMFSGIRRPKVLAAMSKSDEGPGSIDASAGRIDTKKAVWDYLVNNMGMNREGASGVMGNIEQESHFDTGAYNPNDNDGHPSGGLVQWHAGRYNNLREYADSIGKSWDSVDAQMGYLDKELNSGYRSVYNSMKTASSVQDAVADWVNYFEIPADKPGEIARRTPMARSYYNDTTNFVGGANGFANPLSSMLMNWSRRYAERGRAKKLNMEQAARQYAAQTRKTNLYKPATATTPIPASAKVLPAKVDTGGATMDDLLLSIRALDSHNELNQIIGYLAAIANNGGIGKTTHVARTNADEQNMKRFLDKAKLETRAEAVRNRISPERYKDLMNSMDAMGNLSRDQIDIAIDIAKGGNFRNS